MHRLIAAGIPLIVLTLHTSPAAADGAPPTRPCAGEAATYASANEADATTAKAILFYCLFADATRANILQIQSDAGPTYPPGIPGGPHIGIGSTWNIRPEDLQTAIQKILQAPTIQFSR